MMGGGGFGGGMKMGVKGGAKRGVAVGHAPLDRKLFARMFGYTRPYRAKRNTLIALVIVRSIQLPLLPLMVAITLNGPVQDRDWERLPWYVAGFGLLALATSAVFHFRQRLSAELGESVVHDLRRDIFEHLQRLPMRFYDRTKLGSVISRMTSDAEAVRVGVQDVVFVSAVQLGSMLTAAVVMLVYDPVLFGVVLLMSPVLYWMTNFFRVRIGEAWRQIQESFSRVTSTLAESVNGIRVTQGFVRQEVNARNFRSLVEDHGEINMKAVRLTGLFLPLIELNNQFFIALLLLVGGAQVMLGSPLGRSPEEQLAAMVTFFFIASIFFGGIATIGRMYNQALTAMAGAERVFELLDTPLDDLDTDDAQPMTTLRGEVDFQDVGFAYDPDKPVLHDVNFHTEPGRTIALVGQTGSGKSTVIKLISKFYLPTSGRLLIDGRDVREIQTDSLVQQLGIVLQSNFLFSGSVMDNIRLGRPGATDEQVVDAARRLDCLDLLESLPEGLHTVVGEAGGGLSLGQRQLVCFTRAMLADPRILILDEATSSVDTMTEARIQKALQVLLQGRTSFVVAHRLSTIRHADQVLVMDHGRIIERGSHSQLLATGGVYANLYRQFIHAGEA
jgi:ATP-binding cassette subfamily B protein